MFPLVSVWEPVNSNISANFSFTVCVNIRSSDHIHVYHQSLYPFTNLFPFLFHSSSWKPSFYIVFLLSSIFFLFSFYQFQMLVVPWSICLALSRIYWLFFFFFLVVFGKMSVKVLCLFFSWGFSFFFFWLLSLSYLNVFDVNPLSAMWLANVFFHCKDCLLILLTVSFAVQKLLVCCGLTCLFLLLLSWPLVSEKSLARSVSRTLSPMVCFCFCLYF